MEENYKKIQENNELEAYAKNYTETDDEAIYAKAISYCKEHDVMTISPLQRHLRSGFNRTIEYLQRMENDGILIRSDDRVSRWQVVKE